MRRVKYYDEYDLRRVKYYEYDLRRVKYYEYDLRRVKYYEYDLRRVKYHEYDLRRVKYHDEYDLAVIVDHWLFCCRSRLFPMHLSWQLVMASEVFFQN